MISHTKIVTYKKPVLQRTGIIVISKKVKSNFREYFFAEIAYPYKSIDDRKKQLKKLMRTYKHISIIPDDNG